MTAVSHFGFVFKGGQYRVIVDHDPHRGGYSARLISVGLGTLMEPNDKTPSGAMTRLVHELRDFGDRALAKKIAAHAWFPLKV